MAVIRPIKTNFTNGEVDPTIQMRSELQIFVNGAAKMRNVLCLPQGGFRRRDGLQNLTPIPPTGQTIPIGIVSGDVSASGSLYKLNDILELDGGVPLTAATKARFKVTNVPTDVEVLSADIDAGGAGYSPGDLVDVDGGVLVGGGFKAQFEIILAPAGVVTEILLVLGGNYTSGNGPPASTSTTVVSPGVGTGLTLQNLVNSSGNSGVTKVRLIRSGDYITAPSPTSATTDITPGATGTGAIIGSLQNETQNNVQMIEFSFSVDQNYLMVFTISRFYIYRQENTGSGPKQLVFQGLHIYSNQELLELTWSQSLDVMFMFHDNVSIRKITRILEDDWRFEEFAIVNIPAFAFGVRQTARLTADVGSSPDPGENKVLKTNADAFVSGDLGKYIRIFGATDFDQKNKSSYYKITRIDTARQVRADILVAPIINSNFSVEGTQWLLEEPEWSDERGFPRCGTVYQGRFCLAGSKDRPQTFWASRAGDLEDFNNGGTADDLGIVVTADTGTLARILNIYPGRNLQFFADSSEFYIPIFESLPITPSNVIMRRSSSVGSQEGIPVFEIDGAVYFIHRGGASVNQFIFTNEEKAYTANTVSLASSHLIRNPRDASAKKSIDTSDNNFIWVVNREELDNGNNSIAAFSILRSEEVAAWSLLTTEGSFRHTAVLDQVSYFHVLRNNGTVSNIEFFNEPLLFDGGEIAFADTGQVPLDQKSFTPPISEVTGLIHLAGQTVGLIIDDIVREDAVVSVGGVLTFPSPALESYQFGLPFPNIIDDETGEDTGFNVLVKTLPADILLPAGTTMGKKKRVPWVTVRAFETQGFYLQGFQVAFRKMPSEILDVPIPPQSGNFELKTLPGWDEFGQITIGQKEPLKMTILGLAYDLSTS